MTMTAEALEAEAARLVRQADFQRALAAERRRQEARAEYLPFAEGAKWYEGIEDDPIYPHQYDAAVFGAEAGRWILGDGVGLGKTRTAIAWMDLVEAERVIFLTESTLTDQLADEIIKYQDRFVANIAGRSAETRRKMVDQLRRMKRWIIVCNYEVWRRDHALLESMVKLQADTVVVDEAHNTKSTRTKSYEYMNTLISENNVCLGCGEAMFGFMLPKEDGQARRKPRKCSACGWDRTKGGRTGNQWQQWQQSRSVRNSLLMTGTPMLNSPLDFYALLHQTAPLDFPTEVDFRQQYCEQNVFDAKWSFSERGAHRLFSKISGIYLARTREEVGIELPDQGVQVMELTLDKREYPLQYRTIKQISDLAGVMLDSGDQATIMHLIALITRKRQANVWPGGIEFKDVDGNVILRVGDEVRESIKMDHLVDAAVLLHEEGHRQAVFSQFSTALVELKQRLEAEGMRVALLTGDTPKTQRKIIKQDFYKPEYGVPRYDVVLCQYKTGGTGLNLQRVTVTHILDEEWNPGKRDQAYGRSHRIGQDKNTRVIIWRIKGTVDTWLSNILARKEQMLKQFRDARDELSVDVSAEELMKAIKNGEVL